MLRTNLTFLSFIERFCAENKEEAITLKNFKAGYRFIEQAKKSATFTSLRMGLANVLFLKKTVRILLSNFWVRAKWLAN